MHRDFSFLARHAVRRLPSKCRSAGVITCRRPSLAAAQGCRTWFFSRDSLSGQTFLKLPMPQSQRTDTLRHVVVITQRHAGTFRRAIDTFNAMLNSRPWRVLPTATVNRWPIVSVWFKADRPDRSAHAHAFRIRCTTMAVSHRITRLPFSQRNVTASPFFSHQKPGPSRDAGRALRDRRPFTKRPSLKLSMVRDLPRHAPPL
jgi:hypothetical protein